MIYSDKNYKANVSLQLHFMGNVGHNKDLFELELKAFLRELENKLNDKNMICLVESVTTEEDKDSFETFCEKVEKSDELLGYTDDEEELEISEDMKLMLVDALSVRFSKNFTKEMTKEIAEENETLLNMASNIISEEDDE